MTGSQCTGTYAHSRGSHVCKFPWVIPIILLLSSGSINGAEPDEPLPRPLRVCTASIGNFAALCTGGIYEDADRGSTQTRCKDGEDFCGYDIDVWKEVAKELNLTENIDYVHVCLGQGERAFNALISELSGTNKHEEIDCDVGVSSITASLSRRDIGMQFSRVVYPGSLVMMISAHLAQGSTWAFLKPLNWAVWLAVGVTAFVVPGLVFLFENALSGRTSGTYANIMDGTGEPKGVMFGLKEATWHSFASLLSIDVFRVNSLPARLVVLAYGFVVVIITATYTANLAAFLTQAQLKTDIRSSDDLVGIGQNVATDAPYAELLDKRYNIKATPADKWKYKEMVDGLKAGLYVAVIADDSVLIPFADSDRTCNLHILEEKLSEHDLAFAFKTTFRNDKFIKDVDNALLLMQQDGILKSLQEENWLRASSHSRCATASDEFVETTPVSLDNLLGLWIIMGTACLIALLVAACIFRKRWKSLRSLSIQAIKKNPVACQAAAAFAEAGAQHANKRDALALASRNPPEGDITHGNNRAEHVEVTIPTDTAVNMRFMSAAGKVIGARESLNAVPGSNNIASFDLSHQHTTVNANTQDGISGESLV